MRCLWRAQLNDHLSRSLASLFANLCYFIACLKMKVRILSQGQVQGRLPKWERDPVETSRSHQILKLQWSLTVKSQGSAPPTLKGLLPRANHSDRKGIINPTRHPGLLTTLKEWKLTQKNFWMWVRNSVIFFLPVHLDVYIKTKHWGFHGGSVVKNPPANAEVQFSSVAQSCLTLCNPMTCSTPHLPVHCQLPEFTQTHVHWVGDAVQPSHPLSSPSPAFSLSQHQGLFKWISSSYQVAKVLEFRLQHQSLQWIFRTDLL